MEIASLGLEIRSDQVEKGSASLDKLSGAAKRAETATRSLAGGSKATSAASAAVSTSANSAAAALTREASAATKASAAMRTHAVAVNDNARRMGGAMSGLGAQINDIGITAAMGMNPMLIALQQGTQIAGQMEGALQGGASASSVFGQALRSLISPVSLIAIALTAVLAAGLQMVDWAGVATFALNGLASVLETIAPYATMAAAGLALLYAPAIIGGLVSLIAMLSQVGIAAVTAAAAMAAANPAAAFVIGITAAVAAANIFRDELTRIFGVDIVGAAKDGVNAIIGAFVGAYEAIKASWNMLPAALGDLVYSTANAVIGGVESMVNAVAGKIDAFIGKVNSALAKIPDWAIPGEGPIQIGTIGSFDFGGVANPYAGAVDVGLAAARDAYRGAQGTDFVGAIGQGISNAASGAAEKLRELAGGFGSVEEAAGKAGKAAKDGATGAGDAWGGLTDYLAKAKEAFQSAGQSAGGIIKGLISGTMDWKEALSQALSVAFRLMQSLNPNFLGGGFFQGIIGGLLGFAGGGYTGNGATNAAAGVVHGQEYVFSASATRKIGVGNLDAMHSAAKGYAGGGYVTPVMPRMQSPANDRPLKVELVSRFDADGGFETAVERTSRPIAQVESARSAEKVGRAVPSMADARADERQYRRIRPASAI